MFRPGYLTLLKLPRSKYVYVKNQVIYSQMTTLHVPPKGADISHNGLTLMYMLLLSLQFGFQPILAKKYTSHGVYKSSVAISQEVVKFSIAFFMLCLNDGLKGQLSGWNISSFISDALLPAGLFCIQNMAILLAYQNLDSLTFNILNQTKTLSAALCCYLLFDIKQSLLQVISLFLLLASALIIEKVIPIDFLLHGDFPRSQICYNSQHFTHGVLPVLLASFLSGLAGALTENNLKYSSNNKFSLGMNPYLFSMELCLGSLMFLMLSLVFSPDGKNIIENGFFHRWKFTTMIPIITNGIGGVVVGLVTKNAGSVCKGFALIVGLLISGTAQVITGTETLSIEHFFGGFLAVISLWLYLTHPHVSESTTPRSTKIIENK